MTQLTGVFVRLPLSGDQVQALENRICEYEDALIAIGTPVTGGELEVVGYADPEDLPLSDGGATNWTADINAKPDDECTVALVRQSDALAKLAEKDAEIARLQAKQPLYDRMVQENGELKRAVARLQRPEFYGTESQDTGSEDISSLFDFCKDNEIIEINGYRCVSTQFGFFDGTDVHLYGSEDEALSAVKALKGPET